MAIRFQTSTFRKFNTKDIYLNGLCLASPCPPRLKCSSPSASADSRTPDIKARNKPSPKSLQNDKGETR